MILTDKTILCDSAPQRGEHSEGACRILSAAEGLFAEHGFDAVSMSMIAQRAGISKANIYHHFKTKSDLYLAVLVQACRASGGLLDTLTPSQGGLRRDLEGFAGAHLQKLLANESFSRLILRELLEDGPRRGKELAQQGFGQNFARIVAILRDRQARGELRLDLHIPMLAMILIGANVFFFEARDLFRHYVDIDFADDPVRYTGMLVDILLRGILPAGDDAPAIGNDVPED